MNNPDLTEREPSAPGKRERMSTRLVFFIGGFASAAWAPLIPFAKTRLGLEDGALGLLILFFGIGSLSAMPFAGALAGKRGCQLVLRIAVLVTSLCLPLLALVSNYAGMAAVLFLFGAAIGSLDVVVNIQAVLVERASGRSLMSGFHAGWSVGGFAGAGLFALLLSQGFEPVFAAAVVILIVVGLFFVSDRGLWNRGTVTGSHERFRVPHGVVLAVGLLCFVAFLAEGSVLDWGAVFLASDKGLNLSLAGVGYVAFSVVMLVCRIFGDRIVQTLGGFRVLLFGGITAAAGFGVVILASPLWLLLVGFGLIGLGMSNIVPVLMSQAGTQTAMPASQAVSVIGTIAYAGILVGPAAIGGVAHFAGLSLGLTFVAVLVLGIAGSAFIAKRKPN